MSVDHPASSGESFAVKVEDHALTPVPRSERKSGWGLMTNSAGIASTLVQVAIGAAITMIAGVGWGILAGVIVAVFGGVLGWLVGHVAYVSGTSSTVTSRYYGLGRRGSVLASLIFAFMILGFLALENALLYYGTLFMFGWTPSLANAVMIYGVLTVIWILLTIYGMKVVQRTSIILLTAFVVLTVTMATVALANSPLSLGAIMSAGPIGGSGNEAASFGLVVSMLAGSAGALALVDADYARYARSTRDVGILAFGGAVMVDVIVVVLGAVIVHASQSSVTNFLSANPAAAESQMGETIAEKVSWMIANNTGAYFIIIFGVVGFILMYVAQIKAQVLNTYSGSLSLVNLAEGLTGKSPSRLSAVIVGNVIALLMIAGNILGLLGSFLGILGVSTTALAGVIIADYFIVRKRQPAAEREAESVNWAGVISVIVAAVVGSILSETGVTPLGFLVSLIIVIFLYPVLRNYAFKAPEPPVELVVPSGIDRGAGS
ncbi:purine-cytosine permease family protein [Paenarthrobacter sp. NPDC056912]|uniref:purine-cytosine permease family protein n=1 Tax=Paenarthrobacter sp. NPDC056912 TaxID=3345965 RepID=UPI00367141FA